MKPAYLTHPHVVAIPRRMVYNQIIIYILVLFLEE